MSLVDRLRAAIEAAQAGDVLAPVEVVVPSGIAGVTLRRATAGPTGWANVRFSSMPQLAERLSVRRLALADGPLRRPMTPEDRARLVREVLQEATGDGRLLTAARNQPATAALLERVLGELDDVALSPGSALSPRAMELMDLYEKYRAKSALLLSPRRLLMAAVEAIQQQEAPNIRVIVLDDGRFHPDEELLFHALDTMDRLTRVEVAAVIENSRVTGLTVAPDAEEEVRLVVRKTLAQLDSSQCRPERIGIAYVSATPYARLLAEQLTVAGIPHHLPSQRTLAQTVAGRTVLGLLDLYRRDFPRLDVLRWMADGPLIDHDGHRLPTVRWERLSRDAGIFRGLESWRSRLQRYADDQLSRVCDTEEQKTRYDERAAAAMALLAATETYHSLANAVMTAPSWPSASEALVATLRGTLGKRQRVDHWSPRDDKAPTVNVRLEQDAYDSVADVLKGLASSPGIATAKSIGQRLDEALSASVPSGTTLGRGVLVGPFRSFAAADLDLLLVLGCTEDALPARQRESTILCDIDRANLSPQLATVVSRRQDQLNRWVAALSSAQDVHLSYPRADTRSQRRQFPSPWFLEQAKRLSGTATGPTVAEIDDHDYEAAWLTSHSSFDDALRRAAVFGSEHELDVAMSLHGRVDEVAATDARLQRGLVAARSRTKGTFDEWSGNIGPLPEPLLSRVNDHLSASTLQQWAACPASHFYKSVLGVRDLEDPGSEDTIDARKKGSLVHEVLEALVGVHLKSATFPGMSPDTPWSTADVAQAVADLEQRAAALTARGLTGREVLWLEQLSRLRRAIARILAHDSALRKLRRATPMAAEAAFGRDGADPLVIDLPNQGQVSFAGYIDRVDVTESGGLVVVDYKTGKDYGYDAFPKQNARPKPNLDLIDRGRKLQLLLYSLAARQLQGMPEAEVQAWFWLVDHGDLHRGGLVDQGQEDRLEHALDVVVGGIRGGINPANPGAESWRPWGQTFENCAYCAFDRVCPTTRVEQWTSWSSDSLIAPYAGLADGPQVSA